MAVLAVAMALGSSLVYGVSDFLGGLKSRSLPLLSVLLVSQATALALLAVAWMLFADEPPDSEHFAYALAAGLAETFAIAALYRGLAVGTMGIVAPIAACAPVVPVAAAAVLGELPGSGQSAGIALAVVGVVLISLERQPKAGGSPVGPSVLFGLVTALGFGAFLATMDAASEGGVLWALLVARLTTVGVFGAAFTIRRQPLAIPTTELPVIGLIGVLVLAADALYATATTEGLLSVVAVLGSLYPVVTIALAHFYLHERLGRTQKLGVAVTLIGAAAISVA
jgi:drug/metabolite transporter (DMT)-like permease